MSAAKRRIPGPERREQILTTARGSRLGLRTRLVGLPFGPLDYDPARDGLTIAAGGAAVVLDPATSPAGSGCRRADGWREHDGPTVTKPVTTGFGARLIERGLPTELGGAVGLNFEADGVVCTIDAPGTDATPDRTSDR